MLGQERVEKAALNLKKLLLAIETLAGIDSRDNSVSTTVSQTVVILLSSNLDICNSWSPLEGRIML